MLLEQAVSSFSRTVANEAAKGYYPTFLADRQAIANALKPSSAYPQRGETFRRIAVFDPCAGDGLFLATVKRSLERQAKSLEWTPEVETYAIELDQARCAKIRGVRQKVRASFFETTSTGKFDLLLVNPPYRRGDDLVPWLEKSAALCSYQGTMVLIIPDYEWEKSALRDTLKATYQLMGCWKSCHYDKFRQVIAILSKGQNRWSGTDNGWNAEAVCASESIATARKEFRVFDVGSSKAPFPVLTEKDFVKSYDTARTTLQTGLAQALEQAYPARWDRQLTPAMSVRKAHAVQLAALGSETAGVEVDGKPYLARYWVREAADEFHDPEGGTKTIVRRPVVEPVFLNEEGALLSAKELCEDDSLALREDLMELLLGQINSTLTPLHEVGSDPYTCAEVAERLGLLVPQKEAVQAICKAFAAKRTGVIVASPTGSGKTYVAKGVIEGLGQVAGTQPARRVLFLTQAHLPAQAMQEFEDLGLPVRVIDSFAKLKRYCRGTDTPKGIYILTYGRFRQHPKHVRCVVEHNTMTGSGGEREFRNAYTCPDCGQELHAKAYPRKTEKRQCDHCGGVLWTYTPEGKSGAEGPSYGRWIQAIESGSPLPPTSRGQLPYVRWLKKTPWDLLIADESHEVANAASNQGAAFLRAAAKAKHILALTATVANGYARSWFNLLWAVAPREMAAAGYTRNGVSDFQLRFGAIKEIYKAEEGNRHRCVELVRTSDAPGISPAILALVLPNLVTMAAEDFTDLPPVERKVITVDPHPEVEEVGKEIEKILEEVPFEDRRNVGSLRTLALLRAPDTFCHADDEITLRGDVLGTVQRRLIDALTPKEEALVEVIQQSMQRGERCLIFLDSTQKIDLRPVIAGILRRHAGIDVDVLEDSVPAKKVVQWFEKTKAPVTLAGYKRCGTGLNLSSYTHVIWYQGSTNPRMVAQGEGRVRRVNSAMLHRQWWGEVKTIRYTYFLSGAAQQLCLAYTTEKRMVSRLSEGEVPEIEMDSEMGSVVGQSFATVLTQALQQGNIRYKDPSELIRKLSKEENRRAIPVTPTAEVIPLPHVVPPVVVAPHTHAEQPAIREQLSLFGLF